MNDYQYHFQVLFEVSYTMVILGIWDHDIAKSEARIPISLVKQALNLTRGLQAYERHLLWRLQYVNRTCFDLYPKVPSM